jgi:hypothetical protein
MSPRLRIRGLQFGLQFTAVRDHPGKTGRGGWSSLNRSEQPCSELLMRLGFARSGCGQPLDCSQDFSQGHSQPPMQNDGPGTSGQQAATTGQP